jgi:hypothetical protein
MDFAHIRGREGGTIIVAGSGWLLYGARELEVLVDVVQVDAAKGAERLRLGRRPGSGSLADL